MHSNVKPFVITIYVQKGLFYSLVLKKMNILFFSIVKVAANYAEISRVDKVEGVSSLLKNIFSGSVLRILPNFPDLKTFYLYHPQG